MTFLLQYCSNCYYSCLNFNRKQSKKRYFKKNGATKRVDDDTVVIKYDLFDEDESKKITKNSKQFQQRRTSHLFQNIFNLTEATGTTTWTFIGDIVLIHRVHDNLNSEYIHLSFYKMYHNSQKKYLSIKPV